MKTTSFERTNLCTLFTCMRQLLDFFQGYTTALEVSLYDKLIELDETEILKFIIYLMV